MKTEVFISKASFFFYLGFITTLHFSIALFSVNAVVFFNGYSLFVVLDLAQAMD